MKATYDAAVAYLSTAGRPVEEHRDKGRAATEGYGANGDWMVVAQVYSDPRSLAVYSVPYDRVPPARRETMALLLSRVNNEIVLGNFELDLDDGEVRFKTTIEVGDAPPTSEQLEQLVGVNVTTTDRYLPAIEAVIAGTGADEAWLSRDE